MTNSTIPADAVGSPSPVTASYRWEVPNKAISIQISLDLIDRLEREVIESFKAVTKRGSEIGGILLGRIAHGDKRTVFVENCEAATCDYSRGPLYLLSDADKDQLRQIMQRLKSGPLSVVGFFRSNTRKDLSIDQDEDFALAQEFFPDLNQVFLLIKPFAMKPSAAGFFLWEDGHIQAESPLQFPFRRSELMKLFPESIVQPGTEKASAATAPATIVREERSSGPVIVPKREERPPVAPPMLRQEPKPGPVVVPPKREEPSAPPPPLSFKREERPITVTPSPRREEPTAPPPPLSFKREERPPVAPPPKSEQPPVQAPPLSFKREERPPVAPPLPPRRDQTTASPVSFKREERAAAPPMAQKREERPAPPPLSFRREERSSGTVAVPKREEPPRPPVTARREEPVQAPVTPKREEPIPPPVVAKREEPAPPPVVAKREEPVPPPVTAKREERPAVFPKPEERPVPVAPAATVPPPAPPKLEEPPKREERPAVQPIAVKREQPAPAPPPEKKEERREQRAAVAPPPPKMEPAPVVIPLKAPEPLLAAAAEPAKRGKLWIGVGVLAALLLAVGGWYTIRSRSAQPDSKPADASLGLKVERNAGQLVLSWNRNADIVKTAQKATLSITDGANTEDVDLDLSTLRGGSAVYSAITNDVGFKLEVSDLKNRKSLSESIRALSGRPSAAVTPQVAGVKPPAPPVETKPQPVTNQTNAAAIPAGLQPAIQRQFNPPPVTVNPPAPDSLARRLSLPAPAPEPPPVASNSITPTNQNPVTPQPVAPPPTPVKVAEAQPQVPTPQRVVPPPAPVPQPVQPEPAKTKVGGVLVEPRVMSRVSPAYPPMARQMGISGSVKVEATVGKDGRVKTARAISGPQVLRSAAENAVRQWKYTAGTLNGEPVEVPVSVNVDFARH